MPADSRQDPVRVATLGLGVLGGLALMGVSFYLTLTQTAASDLAGFDAALRAATSHLGCPYSRTVQFAAARGVPGLATPARAGLLIWHFNEPLAATWPLYPLLHLPITDTVWIWQTASVAALAGAAALLWRDRGALPPLLTGAVIVALLCNEGAGYGLALGQDDSFLLLAMLCGLACLRRGRDWPAGLAFGIVALKPQLIFLVFVTCAFQRRWRACAGMAAATAVLWGASVAAVGPACAATWLRTASAPDQLQIGVGLPVTLARLTQARAPAEALFAVLTAAAVAVAWRLRHLDAELLASMAVAGALIIGLHTLLYDLVFLAPLGMKLARRHPLAVFAGGWLITVAYFLDIWTGWNTRSAVRLTTLIPVALTVAAMIAVTRSPDHGGGNAMPPAIAAAGG